MNPYVLLNQSHFMTTVGYESMYEPTEEDHLSKAYLMASQQDQVYKEMEVQNLAKFTAYCNKSIKVVFEDRTIVRMMQGCESIRILTRLGEEVIINLHKQR